MKYRHPLFLLVLLSLLITSCGAKKHFRDGDEHYEYLRYSEAIKSYEKGLKKERNVDYVEKTANSYYFTGNFSEAKPLYEEVIKQKSTADKMNFYYARVLMSTGDVKGAKEYL